MVESKEKKQIILIYINVTIEAKIFDSHAFETPMTLQFPSNNDCNQRVFIIILNNILIIILFTN